MTERKPADLSFESWVDRQIREAAERGEFDNLQGAGEPLPDVDQPYDELWWVKRKLREENLSYLPESLALRKAAEDALAAAAEAATEQEARRILTALNQKIRDALRRPLTGPPLNLAPLDVERHVAEWREQRGA